MSLDATESAPGPELEQIVLTRAEGTRFALTLARAAGADSRTPLVLVQPAMGMGARYYGPLLEQLVAAGVHAAVVEQRGHEAVVGEGGGRRPGRTYDFGYADLLDDLDAAITTLRAELPEAPIHLLGHSLGGQLAVIYAAQHPDALAGIVLVGASTPHWPHWGPRLLFAGYAFPTIATLLGHFPGKRLKFAGRESRGLMRDWGHLARTGRFVVGESGLPAVGVPVLSISIEGDWLAPVAAVDALVDKLPAASVSRVHVDEDGIDHFRWARRAEPVVPLITGWLRTVAPTP